MLTHALGYPWKTALNVDDEPWCSPRSELVLCLSCEKYLSPIKTPIYEKPKPVSKVTMVLQEWHPIDVDTYGWKERWGERFYWTPKHHKPKDLQKLIHKYDVVASEALERLDEIVPPPYAHKPAQVNVEEKNIEGGLKPDGEKKERRDLYELMAKYADKDEKIGRLWTEIHTVPEWVSWEQIERGQKVFWRYGGPSLTTVSNI